MNKKWVAVVAALAVTAAAFAAKAKFPSYLEVSGTTLTGVKNQKKLPANLVIPDGVTEIGKRAFSNCASLTSVNIPGSVTEIGDSAFSGCTLLASVTIPGSVKAIGDEVFRGCTSLASVTIPSSVTEIGYNAFSGCSLLASVTIPDGVTVIGVGAFSGCSLLASVTIPGSVTEIGGYAFSDCTSLASVTIPASVTAIGDRAFGGCTSLTSMTIPASVTSIGSYTFHGCTSLKNATIPESVTEISYSAFDECTSLKEIQFNGTTAQWQAIHGSSLIQVSGVRCSDGHIGIEGVPEYLKTAGTTVTGYTGTVPANLVIPDGVTTIGNDAFKGCTSLASVTIPGSMTQIDDRAFDGCTSLKEIQFNGTTAQWRAIQGSVQIQAVVRCSDGHIGIEGVPEYLKTAGTTVTGYTGTVPANLVIPDGVTQINDRAFDGCTSLKSVTIPNGVTEIGESAFWGCTSLESVAIPNSVTAIGYRAFHDCTSLKSVIIPASVTAIGNYAFSGCTSLTEIQFKGTTAQWRAIRGRAIQGSSEAKKVATIRCSDGSLSAEAVPDYFKMDGTKITGYTGTLPANLVIPDGVTEIERGV
ncbi:MAG: leucine-rich repeat domain-containing protein, partial [Treponema sp.]|nr:leucine-rich repeat domain-containing protein [Treponema sp.]